MKSSLFDNLSYKIVALAVATILWVSMIGRKDTILVKEFELQVLLGPNIELESPIPQLVKVELVGPRVALKKINQMSPVFTVDLTGARVGRQIIELSRNGLNLPIGARVQSIEPHEFTASLRESNGTSDSHP
jgi:YbbR domain-containing protein